MVLAKADVVLAWYWRGTGKGGRGTGKGGRGTDVVLATVPHLPHQTAGHCCEQLVRAKVVVVLAKLDVVLDKVEVILASVDAVLARYWQK